MKSMKIIVFLIISMIIVILLIVGIILLFFFDFYPQIKPKNNYVTYDKIKILEDKKNIIDLSNDKTSLSLTTTTTTITSTSTTTIITKIIDKDRKIKEDQKNININIKDDIFVTNENNILIKDNFHSFGEYISKEEYNYRVSLIKNLRIKTVIIDYLTKGNGVSQEFFRVVYKENMIPVKILEKIVESKEFRELIPSKYLKDEIKIKGLEKGESIVFTNENIKKLLILWSKSALTPYQKIWLTNAEK